MLHACDMGMTYKYFIDCGFMNVFGSNTINTSMHPLLLYISDIIITLFIFSQ